MQHFSRSLFFFFLTGVERKLKMAVIRTIMREEDEIQAMADKAADEANEPTRNRRNSTYEEGVRNALDWVLGNEDSAPLE